MATRIAMFNHKGGVSKTTTTFHLGWMLASLGKRVVMVDTDPQCNLTGLVLGYKGASDLEVFYKAEPDRNIRAALAPAFESRPQLIKPVDCVPVQGCTNLFLLPGHIRLSEYEVTLGIAQELSGSIQTLQNLPGSFSYLLDETAKLMKADFVLIDMNPSLSSINQNLLMTSHHFIVPTSPDFFSVMALDSLATVLPKWNAWANRAAALPLLTSAAYPFPLIAPRFLGTIIQKFRPRGGAPASGFQKWVDDINAAVINKLVPALAGAGMVMPPDAYAKAQTAGNGYCLATIPDFNTLIAKAQKAQTPVFSLTPTQIGHGGEILKNTLKARDTFKKLFKELADRVIVMTA
jgi:cellulose biosynthesis protein BcsQ